MLFGNVIGIVLLFYLESLLYYYLSNGGFTSFRSGKGRKALMIARPTKLRRFVENVIIRMDHGAKLYKHVLVFSSKTSDKTITRTGI